MAYQNIETLNANQPLPPLAAVMFALTVTVLKWEQRKKTRRALKHLDSHLLADIGVSRVDAAAECAKRFWQD